MQEPTSASIVSAKPTELTKKQQDLLSLFDLDRHGIKSYLDPVHWELYKELYSLDIEHDENGNLVGIGLYYPGHHFYHTYITHELKGVLSSIKFICHNGISDIQSLREWGIDIKDIQLIHDTYLMGHIIDSSHRMYGLKEMAKRDLEIEYPSYSDIVGKRTAKVRTTLDKQPVELVQAYNGMDCFATYRVYEKQKEKMTTEHIKYYNEIESPLAPILAKMEARGICIDVEYLNKLKTELELQQLPIKDEIINELGPINLNSPKQLLGALNAKGITPILKNKPSTDKRALRAWDHLPIVQHLLHFSEIETLLSSFVLPYLERQTSIVHPFFNQCGTRTGRLSCSNPNLLQIPKRTENGQKVRRMFVARPGHLLGDCDFGQIEPRVLAHLSKDPNMLQLFNDGIDFHTFTAERLGINRDRAKVLNLSVGYRATFKSVAYQLQCSDQEAQNEINKWWGLFPSLRRWQERIIHESKRSGFCTTLFGRRIVVDNLNSGNKWQRESAERQLINNITQGSAAEIMKKAMLKLEEVRPQLGILVQVYDELLFESPTANIDYDLGFIKGIMEGCVQLDVPLVVEAKKGLNWAECR